MQKGVYFNGRMVTHPGAYATIDAKNMTAMSTGAPKVVALIGSSKGGVPGQVMWFTDPSEAKRVLKGGYLLKAAQKTWSPVKGGGGAYMIACIRVDKATQSHLSLGDGVPVLAQIGKVVTDSTNMSTGQVTASGTYTGEENAVLEIMIDSESTQDLTKTTARWRIAGDEHWSEEKSTKFQSGEAVTIKNGVSITFGKGNYVSGSIYKVDLIAAKKQRVGAVIDSKDYGAWTQKLQVKLEAGSIKGTKKLTAYYWEEEQYEIFQDLGAALHLQYVGDQPYAHVYIEHDDTGKAIKLYTKIGKDSGSAVKDIEIDLTESRFTKMVELADYLSGYTNYVCRYHPTVRQKVRGIDLDACDLDITSEALITAFWRDMCLAVTETSKYISMHQEDTLAKTPANFAYTNLEGGTNGEIPASWIPYFDMLSAYNINYIVPLTSDAGIHAEARASVTYLSDTMGRERTVKLGGGAGESIEQTKQRALSHNNDRVQLAYPGFYDYNEDGELELYPAFIGAAMLAGRDAFLPTGESATFDCFDMVALEKELQPMEVNELLNSGVATFEFVIGKGCRLVQDITTYTQDSVSLHTERSVRELADGLNQELRDKVEERIIGDKGITNLDSVKNIVIGVLQQKIKDEIIVAYRNVRINYFNKVINIEYEAAPVEPTNFVLISGHFYTADQIEG